MGEKNIFLNIVSLCTNVLLRSHYRCQGVSWLLRLTFAQMWSCSTSQSFWFPSILHWKLSMETQRAEKTSIKTQNGKFQNMWNDFVFRKGSCSPREEEAVLTFNHTRKAVMRRRKSLSPVNPTWSTPTSTSLTGSGEEWGQLSSTSWHG